MRTLFIIMALAASPATAEPLRWSADAHDTAAGLARATRLYVSRRHMRVECEVTNPRTREYTVKKASGVPTRAKGLVCLLGSPVGTVCVEEARPGVDTVRVAAEAPFCASGPANVDTGD